MSKIEIINHCTFSFHHSHTNSPRFRFATIFVMELKCVPFNEWKVRWKKETNFWEFMDQNCVQKKQQQWWIWWEWCRYHLWTIQMKRKMRSITIKLFHPFIRSFTVVSQEDIQEDSLLPPFVRQQLDLIRESTSQKGLFIHLLLTSSLSHSSWLRNKRSHTKVSSSDSKRKETKSISSIDWLFIYYVHCSVRCSSGVSETLQMGGVICNVEVWNRFNHLKQ